MKHPPPAATGDDGMRLSKRVAEMEACSRREAEQLIEGGWVQVNGVVVEEPPFRVAGDAVITIDPSAQPAAVAPVTLLLHKPPGFDAGTGEPVSIKGLGKGLRPSMTLLDPANHHRNGPHDATPLRRHLIKQSLCLPLETGASGLVVFTQDWRIERKLVEDAAIIEQEFTVEVQGGVDPQVVEQMSRRGAGDDRRLPTFKVSVTSTADGTTRLRFAVKGSHPGLIAWLCNEAALQMTAMRRIRIGRLPLAGLPQGQWRYLQAHERF